MSIGSFEGLYTFLEVAEIYGIDSSCLRKQVSRGKFVIDEDIKKIGTTWIITEQAMVKNFGSLKFEEYKNKKSKKEKRASPRSDSKAQDKKINTQKIKTKSTRSNKKATSINEKEEKLNDSWSSGEIKGVELKNFAFNTNITE